MNFVLSFLQSNKWYLPFFILGVLASIPYSPEEIHGSLEVVGVLMLVALFASLLVPFAAFSREEMLNKFWLQNAPLAAFGAYAVEVSYQPSAIKIVLMVAAMGMHLSYWGSGIHSRAYRLEQLKLSGLGMREQLERIAKLNANGRSGEADVIVKQILAINE